MIFNESELVCPRGTPGKEPLIIDIASILAAERRQDEVAIVTKFKAPELLAEFNRSWRKLHDQTTELAAELLDAGKALEKRRSVLLLEIVPSKLKERGLVNNDAHRAAVINLDPQFQALQDTYDQIEAALEWLKGKAKFFENAYHSVKKIMGEDSYNMAGKGGNPRLSIGAEESPQPVTKSTPPSRGGWGKAKY
jgi:hypothetical protein